MLRVQTSLFSHLQIDLEVKIHSGRLNVLCGENGIGKSTLLRHLSVKIPDCVLCEQRALVHFFDRPLGSFRKILSKSENLNRTVLDDFWTRAGFSSKEDRSIISLSGGESQLLKLLIHGAAPGKVYLFDEPGQALDREKKQLASELLTTLVGEEKKVLIVEHDQRWLPPGSEVLDLENVDGILKKKGAWTI